MPPPAHQPPSVGPVRRPADERLHNRPQVNPGQAPAAPDGRQRRQSSRINTATHQATVVNNNTYIQETVFAAPGWYQNDDVYYYNPDGGGLLGVFYGDLWFWTYYAQDHWWWLHPAQGRWLVLIDGRWWYYSDGIWMVWSESDDTFYAVYPDHVEPENPGENNDQVYYSPDSSRAVYVTGPDKQAHLYTYPDLERIAYLGSGVTRVSFTTDSANDDALVVYLEFSEGDPKWFDRDGNIYGASSEPDPNGDGQAGLNRALQATPTEMGASGRALTDVSAVANGAAVDLTRTPRRK